jgi:hypothetical protein
MYGFETREGCDESDHHCSERLSASSKSEPISVTFGSLKVTIVMKIPSSEYTYDEQALLRWGDKPRSKLLWQIL